MRKIIPYILLLSVTLVIACNKGDDRRPDASCSSTISISEHQSEIRSLQIKYATVLALVVGVAILFNMVTIRKLNRKNMALIRQAKETELAERISAQTFLQIPSERLDNDQLLYSKLLDIMEGQKMPYTNPDCNRDILAQLCATNGKYIHRIISPFADKKTTSEIKNN